ncbi:acyl-CoA dehydrogenase family protein [Sporichthya polymorpha]|uniref:acyl-CoA dehydrogenase family protein n=1 Tax=Sporichthya polymorpha TaxID=35751 RepID=UPI00037A455C|nr:acyl-CoA dehydrogenase family protein [Sporichthya polymorpha]
MPLDLVPDDVQRAIVDAAVDLLDPAAAAAALRARADGPVRDAGVWEKAAAQGWFGLAVPEEAGGLGLGAGELALLHRELGRTLTAGPYLGTTVAATLFPSAELIGGLPVGVLVADGVADAPSALGPRVTGTFRTDDREDAAAWLVLSPTGAALVEAAVTVEPTPDSMDPGARPARVAVDAAARYAEGPAAWTLATVLVAAYLAGLAQASVAASVAHTAVREQFGRPIGSFQMVQQRCADMATRADAATQLALLAALAAVENPDERVTPPGGAGQLAASALLVASDAAVTNARDDIQNHGGMGFTWEVDAHLRLRRAHGLRARLGDAADVRAAVLDGPAARAW